MFPNLDFWFENKPSGNPAYETLGFSLKLSRAADAIKASFPRDAFQPFFSD
jgi:hypothetical protein